MQRPGEPGAARFGPPEGCADHRPHRYRSFMIEEILTEPPGPKGAAPAAAAAAAGELLKFGVQALLAARPFHSHLGTCSGRRAADWAWRADGSLRPGVVRNPSSFSPRFLERPGMQLSAGPRHLPLFAHSNGKLEGASNELGRNQALCPRVRPVESLSSASGRLRVFKSGDRPGPGTRARIPMVATKSIYQVLWIKMTSNQEKPEFHGRAGLA